jgi:hypothetical protein
MHPARVRVRLVSRARGSSGVQLLRAGLRCCAAPSLEACCAPLFPPLPPPEPHTPEHSSRTRVAHQLPRRRPCSGCRLLAGACGACASAWVWRHISLVIFAVIVRAAAVLVLVRLRPAATPTTLWLCAACCTAAPASRGSTRTVAQLKTFVYCCCCCCCCCCCLCLGFAALASCPGAGCCTCSVSVRFVRLHLRDLLRPARWSHAAYARWQASKGQARRN